MPGPDQSADAYPTPLQAAEEAAVAERRRRARVPADEPRVAFALSGGGIRSATFCLGLFQALARHHLVRRIDLLSTVSGGGYFGSFLGAAFTRERADADRVEAELKDNHSWAVGWLRDNGRFLSPNGSGDNWVAAAVALRNWCALHVVLLTFGFLLLSIAALVRSLAPWSQCETWLWTHKVGALWLSPWVVLPALSFAVLMLPFGIVYWLTQIGPLIALSRRLFSLFASEAAAWKNSDFANRAQVVLTRCLAFGLSTTVILLAFALVDSLGQTIYWHWSAAGFGFPSMWAIATAVCAGLFGFGGRVWIFVERLLPVRKLRISFAMVALALGLLWLLLIVVGLSVLNCYLAWQAGTVEDVGRLRPMSGVRELAVAAVGTFLLSWWFSRSFSFVNLSSMQQVYAARLCRAYTGASNPQRQIHRNYRMTEAIPGDDIALADYRPHRNGGPLHLVNVTINETLSGKSQVQRRDRKGLVMAVGPCGISIGTRSHALWAEQSTDGRKTGIRPVPPREAGGFHALQSGGAAAGGDAGLGRLQRIEDLTLARWIAISGAAFTTGTGAGTQLGLSLLLGLANVRLGYWWDSGAPRIGDHAFLRRLVRWFVPVQACLVNEVLARFHGPARRYWYLSDGGHFENTACYELIRRRVPFIVCSDAGQDPRYEFADFANLVRMVRTDFGAEIEVVRRRAEAGVDDDGGRFPMPRLEDIVHEKLRRVIGSPADFPALREPPQGAAEPAAAARHAGCHALLARVHYLDNDQFSWLLLVKPSLMGDETADVLQYQRTHALFPQEPTSDQYFDEAQWESYRKLGEHIGDQLFTAPPGGDGWFPAQLRGVTQTERGAQAHGAAPPDSAAPPDTAAQPIAGTAP